MADPNDVIVDRVIVRLQDVLDDLKAAQKKDDQDEDSYDEKSEKPESGSLKDAAKVTRRMFADRRKASGDTSSTSSSSK